MIAKACPLCGWDAETESSGSSNAEHVRCRRSGEFIIDRRWKINHIDSPRAESRHDIRLLPALEAYIQAQNRQGHVPVNLTDDWIERAEAHMRTPVTEKTRKLLALLASRSRPGVDAVLNPVEDAPLIDAVDSVEVDFCAKYLIAERLMLRETHEPEYRLTMDGWRAVDPGPGGIPGRGFVAMSFDSALLPAWTEGFYPALKMDCGLDPVRVDRGNDFNDRIDDRIIVEIRRAEFVVADVTGHWPSVYFEAGFAMALGRHLIWTCRADYAADLHFDTRQYPHIVWTSTTDLREKLSNRVRATIPSAQARLGS